MQTRNWAGLDAVLVGGTDREGGGDGPLVVLLHGYGAPGTDLVPLWRIFNVPSSVRFLFPAAPLALDMMPGARAWWPIDMMEYQRRLMLGQARALSAETPPAMLERREQIVQLCREARTELRPSKLLLGGFSQGAMLATETALFGELSLDGLILFSGTLLSEDRWLPALPTLAETPVFQSHGEQDPVLDFAAAEALHDALIAASIPTTWKPFRGAHQIPDAVLQSASQFICDALA